MKANLLIEASYHLTLAEHRVLLCALGQIDSRPGAVAITDRTPFPVTAAALADLCGLPRNQAYELLKSASERLAERWVFIATPDPANPSLEATKLRWVYRLDYLPSEGRLCLYLTPDILPYLTQLAGTFTRYAAGAVAGLKSVYAFRLYELLVQWRGQGSREIPVASLRHILDLGDQYLKVSNLVARVVEPAVRDLNRHSDILVEWQPRRRGRGITGFLFTFEPRAGEDGASHIVVPMSREEIASKALPGETWDMARHRLQRAADGPGSGVAVTRKM